MKRPKRPPTFNKDVKDVKKDVKKAIRQNKTPLFPEIWKKYKSIFFNIQNRKCGYCERKLNEYGDVEHYRPKAQIDELSNNKKEWGKESITNTLHGRKFQKKYDTGYWWLAYEWNNYLLSCRLCNSPYKKNLFPIKIEADRKIKPFSSKKEIPLLINPFNNSNMTEHFTYDKLGVISNYNSSEYGFETIKTCGLDRMNLRDARSSIAEFVYRKLRLLSNSTNSDLINESLIDIYNLGKEDKEFSGMVRIIFEQNSTIKWNDLKNIISN